MAMRKDNRTMMIKKYLAAHSGVAPQLARVVGVQATGIDRERRSSIIFQQRQMHVPILKLSENSLLKRRNFMKNLATL